MLGKLKTEGNGEKGEMVQWHHAHESEQSFGDSKGQGNLMCRNPWVCKE